MDTTDLIRTARSQALGDLPRRSARRYPDKLAVIDGDTRLTFAELEAAVDRTAAALADAGLEKGDRLALLSHNCWQFAVLDFATARVGVVLVPVNFMLGGDEIAFILDHSGARAFVVEDALVETADRALAAAEKGTVTMRRAIALAVGVPDGWDDLQGWLDHDGTPPAVLVDDDDPVRMMFTSGTESRPKGALLSSRSLMWQYATCVIDGEYSPDDVDVHALPLYHCAQLDVLPRPGRLDRRDLGDPARPRPGRDPGGDRGARRQPVLRAADGLDRAAAPPRLRRRGPLDADQGLLRRLADAGRGAQGDAEPAARRTPLELLRPDRDGAARDLARARTSSWSSPGPPAAPRSTSRPGSSTTRTSEVPAGEVGEIVHRSPHATLGYYEDEEKTAEAFRNGWFHSGDLGYVDDTGHLYVVDRKKDMIKTGGENVASREVEEAVYELEGVAEVAVFGVSHPRWVEAVVAAVVPKAGATLTPEAVIEHSRTVLAGYKTPKYVVIVDALPKNPSGKIVKRDLRDEHADLAAGE